MKRIAVIALAVVLCGALVGLTGCYRQELPENQKINWGFLDHERVASGDTINRNVTVPLEDAETLDASIRMGVGELRLEAGGSDALQADFEYRPASLKPEVSYDVASGGTSVGNLTVEQPDQSGFPFNNATNIWDLELAKDIPLDLTVDLGAGESDLLFGGLGLRSLTMNMGAGDTTLDFSGDWDHDVTGQVQAGIGQLTFKLPANVGARVFTHNAGIGEVVADQGFTENNGVFVNRAYGETTTTIEISVQRGIGEVKLETVR